MKYRANLIWPVLIIGVGIVMFLISAEIIPEAIGDVLIRSWPVLLIIFGLNVIIGQRIRYANWVILGLGVGMVVLIAQFAYAERSGEYRTDNQVSISEELPENVEAIAVEINVRDTRVAISSAPSNTISAQFEGSTESDVNMVLDTESEIATLSINEDRPGVLPRLEAVGRGTLNVFLPDNVQIVAIEYVGDDGSVTADLMRLNLDVVNFQIDRGNMRLCLPQEGNLIQDAITLENGDLTVVVPPDVTIQLELGEGAQPEYSGNYDFLADGTLKSQIVTDFDVILQMNVSGDVIIQDNDICSS